MTFNPNEHLTDLRGKQYLEVKWRLVWFKDEHKDGGISTEIINYEPLIIKATIVIDGVIVATGHGTADDSGKNVVWKGKSIEKAETAAIGRALAHAGYGTQFSPDDDEDGVVDSPVQRKATPTPPPAKNAANGQPNVNPVWFDVAVGEAWTDLKAYLLEAKIYTNDHEMKNSMIKRGVIVDNKIAETWKHKLASELVAFLKSRHEEKQTA